jgi:hypothetical protein
MPNIEFYESIDFNPIPIFTFNFEKNFITEEHVDAFAKLNYLKNARSSVQINHGYDDDILELETFKDLKKYFDEAINLYTNKILKIKNNFKMIHSWVTKNEKYSNHYLHTHDNIMLSAVAYFNEDLIDEEFSPILIYGKGLKTIFQDFNFELDVIEYNKYNSTSWTIFPKLKQIIVFPGHLLHESAINDSDKTRYCIGTNYFIEGEVGLSRYTRYNISISKTSKNE